MGKVKYNHINVSYKNLIYLLFPLVTVIAVICYCFIPMSHALRVIVILHDIILMICSIPFILIYFNRKIMVSDEGIIYFSLLNKEKRIQWTDVKSVEIKSMGKWNNAKIVFKMAGRMIAIPYYCAGFSDLKNYLYERRILYILPPFNSQKMFINVLEEDLKNSFSNQQYNLEKLYDLFCKNDFLAAACELHETAEISISDSFRFIKMIVDKIGK